MINDRKVLFEVKIDLLYINKLTMKSFLFVQQIQCHMVNRTFNQLNVLTIQVPI